MEAVDALEKELGLTGHARVVVMHEKLGRQHFHPVWTRIDLENMRAVSDSHNYRKHEQVSRDLERRFGHPRVQGAHVEREGVDRPNRTPSRAELRQEERTGITGKQVKAEVTAAFRTSDTAEAFKAALEDKGYLLAQGDRRDFVVVDPAGGIHSLARRINGMRATDLREFMNPIDRKSLPSADAARDTQIDRERGIVSMLHEQAWNDKLAKNAIDKARHDDERDGDAQREARNDARKARAAQREAEREAHKDAMRHDAYTRGDGYVSQSTAAMKDHKRRQRALDERAATENAAKQKAEQEQRQSDYAKLRDKFANITADLTDEKLEKLRYVLNNEESDYRAGERNHPYPDRQPGAPGGGRARSQ